MTTDITTTEPWKNMLELRACLNAVVEWQESGNLVFTVADGEFKPNEKGEFVIDNISELPNRKVDRFAIRYIQYAP